MTFDRQGILWDAINGRTPPSPAAELMAWTFRAVDPDAGTLEVLLPDGECSATVALSPSTRPAPQAATSTSSPSSTGDSP